jgi:hypothetical protein
MTMQDETTNGAVAAPKEETQFLLRAAPIEFAGRDFAALEKGFCAALGVRELEQVLTDVLITDQRVIAAPATKDRSGLAAIALLLGTGGLAAATLGLLSGVASLWAKGTAGDDEVSRELMARSAIAECAVWDRTTVSFEVFEQRDAFDLLGGEWSTSPRFSGPCRYRGNIMEAAFEVPFGGRFANLPFRSKPTDLEPLMRVLGYDVSQVKRRSSWRKKGM